ncbi:MAG: zinc ribbon domain-containing protein [Burkholderiales bacterium]|nr:zinc ribbon domain-containing protein [Anaerolineae bacterium]
MSKAKFDAARELIREKKFTEARAVLNNIDHYKAQEWLAKLNDIEASNNTIYCEQCGNLVSNSSKFCNSCGNMIARHEFSYSSPVVTLEKLVTQPTSVEIYNSCPSCGRDDTVIKIASIVAMRVVKKKPVDYGGVIGYVPWEKHESLVRTFSKPSNLGSAKLNSANRIFLILLLVFCILANIYNGAINLCASGLGVLIVIVLVADLLPRQQMGFSLDRWNRSYYCKRCDVTFVAGESSYAPSTDFLRIVVLHDQSNEKRKRVSK